MVDQNCSSTQQASQLGFLSKELQATLGVLSAALIISLAWNIFCCVSKFGSGKWRCPLRRRQSQSLRQMEENPIYGNLSYLQTSVTYLTEDNRPHSSLSSSNGKYQRRVRSDLQSKNHDCYANLTLKGPRLQAGHSCPQIQYSDVMQLGEPPESEKEDDGNTDALSTVSDLYASVQTQRTKTIDSADNEEGYANHL
ncbi:signaling threshold-regulating transmembrane adapter 1 [Haplochromis burtoni]|uniref:signaling threshold-regulating transmembrane adapter 1 n=1 Tax=Haplochromis burtoni TaxID=8153 RepID=UPI0003BD7261|nr:signaling threshold-regulating transmembrane adapter 1 [Haplochromis burtoni]